MVDQGDVRVRANHHVHGYGEVQIVASGDGETIDATIRLDPARAINLAAIRDKLTKELGR